MTLLLNLNPKNITFLRKFFLLQINMNNSNENSDLVQPNQHSEKEYRSFL